LRRYEPSLYILTGERREAIYPEEKTDSPEALKAIIKELREQVNFYRIRIEKALSKCEGKKEKS